MKKIVVMSDNHGRMAVMQKIKEVEPKADYYVHCGDSDAMEEELSGWIAVRGNNDWKIELPESLLLEVEDVRFFICHGHTYGYYNRELHMISELQDNQCQVMLFGHTHVPQCKKVDGYYLINPGSTTIPRGGSKKGYCVITVDNESIDVEFKELS